MNEEFAIEPTAFKSSSDMKYVLEKFGFHRGKFIIGFPSKWNKQVYEHIQKFPDIEKARASRLLEKAKHSIFKSGDLGFDPSSTWVNNVHRAAKISPFYGIIAADSNSFSYPTIPEIDDDFFGSTTDIRVVGSVDNYSNIAKHLLQKSQEVVIIDPYLRLDRPVCESVIKSFLSFSQQGTCQKKFVFWLREKNARIKRPFEHMLEEKYKPCLFPNTTITVKLVDDDNSTEKMHARILLSTLGGLRFDHGFEEFKDGRKVDVSLVSKQAHDAHCSWYLDPNSRNDFIILEEHVVHG